MQYIQYIDEYRSPLGKILMAADESGLTGLWFEGQKYYAASLGAEHEWRALEVFAQTKRWLDRYFSGGRPGSLPPLHPAGTPFQIAVWESLSAIPYGRTATYGEIAERGGGKAGKVTYVCSRGGFGGGAESDFHPHPLPQGGGSGWKPDRVCRRTRKEVEAFEAGRSRFERGRQASLTALLRKGKTKKGRQRRTTENGRREGGRFPFLMRGEIVSCSSICLLSYR